MILYHLGIYLPHEDGFSEVKSFYIGSAYGSICGDYGVDADEKSMDGDWFYSKKYGVFGDGRKVTERLGLGNLRQWIITHNFGQNI